MKITTLFAAVIMVSHVNAQSEKSDVLAQLDEQQQEYGDVALQIWQWAEVGYQEAKSSALLQQTLKNEGFTVEAGVADIPTAFVAEYGNGKPVIGILAEFDALPGVSQGAVPFAQPREEVSAGHACGHHLFGTASTAAGIQVKEWLEKNKIEGTIRVFGTPAEEGGAGKVYMARAGLFDDVDVVLHWHPSSANAASARSSLANKSAKFRFYGAASHAAAAPHRGRSALDGVEAMNYMVNMLREHVPQETRIHYVITSGGEAPNVVPAFAEVYYYVRHPEVEKVMEIFERVVNAGEGAAKGTHTEMKYEIIHGIYNVLPNATLSRIMYSNLQLVGGVEYSTEEIDFANKIMETYNSDKTIEDANKIMPFEVRERGTGGSTDV